MPMRLNTRGLMIGRGARRFALATLLSAEPIFAQPSGVPTLSEIEQQMLDASSAYPNICKFVDLTATYNTPPTVGGNSLFAVKISDNVLQDEDEPSFLMVSAHHGNEYGTPIVALDTMDRLLSGYGSNATITQLIDEYEIWIAPVWNPDGYWNNRYNGNGVDLNRNYPFLWDSPCVTSIKGDSPASEPETQTMVAWSEDKRFTKVLDFHSSGREVLWGYSQSCGNHILSSYLKDEAIQLSSASSYNGQERGPSSNGEHYQWQLGTYSNYAFLTEISNTQSPDIVDAEAEAARLWPGTLWMLDRPVPIWGHVTDGSTSLPLEASIIYLENLFTEGEQNRSDPQFGRYHAFLPVGTHTLRFEKSGYVMQDAVAIVVADTSIQIDVVLQQVAPSAPDPPTNLETLTVMPDQINLSWEDNSFNEDFFEVQRSEDDGVSFTTITTNLPPNTVSYTDTGLTGNTAYSYRVRATNDIGSSDWSNVASTTTPVCNMDAVCDSGENCNNCPSDCREKTKGQNKYCCDGDVPNCGNDGCNADPWTCGLAGPAPTPGPGATPSPTGTCAAKGEACGGENDPVCCSNNCKNGLCKGGIRRLGEH